MAYISIQLVTHNSQETLGQCLRSIRAQNYRNFSVFAVDNHSDDNTQKLLKKFHIPFLQNSQNEGYARAHNQALAMTKSTLVLVLNPDVQLQPDFLQVMVDFFNYQLKKQKIGSASAKLIRVNNFQEKSGPVDGLGLFMRRDRKQGLINELEPDITGQQPFPIFGPDGAAPIFLRAMLDDIAIDGEVFDEDFYINKEDIDVCWRAQLYGWKSMAVPQAIAHHIRTFRPGIKNRKRVNSLIRKCAVRNRYLMMIKNDQWQLVLKDLLPILWYELQLIGFLLLRERGSLKAYMEVILLFPKMWKKRHIIQTHKAVSMTQIQTWFV